MTYAGWRMLDAPGWKELDEFLFARAMEHDSPKLLFRLACEYLCSEQVVRPGVVLLLEHVATARERARAETWLLLAPLIRPESTSKVAHVIHRSLDDLGVGGLGWRAWQRSPGVSRRARGFGFRLVGGLVAGCWGAVGRRRPQMRVEVCRCPVSRGRAGHGWRPGRRGAGARQGVAA